MRQLLNWFRRGRLESGLDRELQYHMDRRVSDLMRSGLPEREARKQARLAKDWRKSDELRDRLADLGWEVRDTKDGQKITRRAGF